MDVLHSFRRYLTKPHVRPWALSAPILVLLVCLPLLRPLRHPDPRDVSDDELARLVVFGGGLVSSGAVLNPPAPAGALLLGAAACITPVAIGRRPGATSGWLAIAGMSAAFAAAIAPPAVIFLLLLAVAVLVMRW